MSPAVPAVRALRLGRVVVRSREHLVEVGEGVVQGGRGCEKNR